MAAPKRLPGGKKRKSTKAAWKGKTYIATTAKAPEYAAPRSFNYSQTGAPCGDSKGKLAQGRPFPQLAFQKGKPFVRFCTEPGQPGPLLPMRDAPSANRAAKRAIAPYPKTGRYKLPSRLRIGHASPQPGFETGVDVSRATIEVFRRYRFNDTEPLAQATARGAALGPGTMYVSEVEAGRFDETAEEILDEPSSAAGEKRTAMRWLEMRTAPALKVAGVGRSPRGTQTHRRDKSGRIVPKTAKPQWMQCTTFGKMTAAKEKKLPDAAFGLVKGKGKNKVRKYPMPDPRHAVSAKGRAKTQLKRGTITKREYNALVKKADRVLKACPGGLRRKR
jgi:hypothetical protein